MEQELSSGLGEWQVAEFIDNDEVAPGELLGGAALAAGPELGLKVVDQPDGVMAAPAEALSDTGAHDGGGKVGLAGAGPADQHKVALTVIIGI